MATSGIKKATLQESDPYGGPSKHQRSGWQKTKGPRNDTMTSDPKFPSWLFFKSSMLGCF
jgi:hypothetical protein